MIFLLGVIGFLIFLRIFTKVCFKKNDKIFVVITAIIAMFFAVFKNIEFTDDTSSYAIAYNSLNYISFGDIIKNLFSGEGKDVFYTLISKFFFELNFSPNLWLGVVAIFFISCASIIIYKYSKEPLLSFIVLLSLGYYYFSLTAVRQSIALAFIFLAFIYIDKEKIWKFVLLVLFGSLFHFSALIFLIAYPLSKFRLGMKSLLVLPIIYIAGVVLSPVLMSAWNSIVPSQYQSYANSEVSLNLSGFIIQTAIYIFVILASKISNKDDVNQYNNMVPFLLIGLFVQIFSTFAFAEFFRANYYFSIFSVILIPNAIHSIKSNYKILIYCLIMLIFIIYLIFSTGNFVDFYKFAWQ